MNNTKYVYAGSIINIEYFEKDINDNNDIVYDVFDLMRKLGYKDTKIILISKICIPKSIVCIADSKKAASDLENFLNENKDMIVCIEVDITNDDQNISADERTKIVDLCWFLEEQGFESLNSYCEYDYSIPYIHRSKKSKKILRQMINLDILPEYL